jgi:thiol-disulfide isomerase/thioredoxin
MDNRARKPFATKLPIRTILTGLAIVVVLVILLVVYFTGSRGTAPADEGPLSPAVLADVTGVSPVVLATVGAGTAAGDIVWLPGPTRNGDNGKPLVVYVGAEYCPFCAVERWPLIVALSRFGTFTNLAGSFSASDDVYPSTPTFTFVGSSYDSQYLAFSAVEVQTNKKVGGVYPPLQTPTALQNQVFQRFNGPPFLTVDQAGGIPFIDIADRYMANGATYDPTVLGGLTRDAIAAKLRTADNDTAKGILGAANRLTAAICATTSNQPAKVCSDPSIQQLETALPKQPTG